MKKVEADALFAQIVNEDLRALLSGALQVASKERIPIFIGLAQCKDGGTSLPCVANLMSQREVEQVMAEFVATVGARS
jgi:hypothetical protein